jgi:hypothetical protein
MKDVLMNMLEICGKKLCRLSLCGTVILVTGCGDPIPYAENERYMESLPEQERRPAMDAEAGESEALKLVKQNPAEEGEGTMADWMQHILDTETGQTMFPRWSAKRRGVNRYEVRFVYTVLGEDYRITKKGYSWSVDLVLRTVGPPRVIPVDELMRGKPRQRRRNRTLEHLESTVNQY